MEEYNEAINKGIDDNRRYSLKHAFEKACNDYITYFCGKHHIKFEGWIGNKIGIEAYIDWNQEGFKYPFICWDSKIIFDMDDIRFDVDNQLPEGHIFLWEDWLSENDYLNLESWVRLNPDLEQNKEKFKTK